MAGVMCFRWRCLSSQTVMNLARSRWIRRSVEGSQRLPPLHATISQRRVCPSTPRRSKHAAVATSDDDKEFTPFYYFPHIVPMRLFSRLKLAQTVLTVSCVPALHLAEYYEVTLQVDKPLATLLATLALSMLYALGEFFRRLVGAMYLDRDQTRVKVSHLTFWGGRRDLVVPLSDIVPLRDRGEDKHTVHKLQRYSTKKFLLFSTRFGRVLSPEKFEVVFGSIGPG